MSLDQDDEVPLNMLCKKEGGLRKRVSIVWSYFEKLDRFRVRCKLCRHEQNYQGTTGNILRHLRAKHNIDATIKGHEGTTPEIMQKITTAALAAREKQKKHKNDEDDEEYDVIVKTEHNQLNIETLPRRQREIRSRKVTSYCEDLDIDPYSEPIEFGEYLDTHSTKDTKSTPHAKKPVQNASGAFNNTKPPTVEEDRILAEIEYFREKAGYYRMQKNLTALQAKKVKYELDQIS